MLQEKFIVLTESTTIALITPAGVWIVDRKTGEVTGFVPEMPILEQFDAVTAATAVLSSTQHVKGAEELRLQAGKFVAAFVDKAEKAVNAKAAKHAA